MIDQAKIFADIRFVHVEVYISHPLVLFVAWSVRMILVEDNGILLKLVLLHTDSKKAP